MRFEAKVLTPNLGVEITEVEASSAEEARSMVEAAGARLLGLTPKRGPLGGGRAGAKGFNLMVFNHQLHALLEAGQPIVDAIEILGHNDRRGRHRSIYDTLLTGLRGGKQLSAAMAALPSVFPALYVALIRSSETTGNVRESVQRFIKHHQQIDAIRSKLLSAAVYPAILLFVGFLVIAFLLLYVVPRFSEVFDDVVTRGGASIGFIQVWGGFVNRHQELAWFGFASLLLTSLTLLLHPRPRAVLIRRLQKLPYVGEKIWILQLARLYRTLGMLLRSGMSLLTALRMTEQSMDTAQQLAMRQATQMVSEGLPLSTALPSCGLSTEVAKRLLLAGESSGNLDEMMLRIADFYDQELSIWMDMATRLVEPILMVVIGLVIGFVVLMLYTPIFDLANAL